MLDASDLRSGQKIRLLEPPRVPEKLYGELVEVQEVQQIGASSFAVRIRDPFQYDGGTERDEDEFAQGRVLCPYTITSQYFEVPTDA